MLGPVQTPIGGGEALESPNRFGINVHNTFGPGSTNYIFSSGSNYPLPNQNFHLTPDMLNSY